MKIFNTPLLLFTTLFNFLTVHASEQFEVTISQGYYSGVPGHGPFKRKRCIDSDILERVCGLGGMNTPQLVDPTGIEGVFDDFGYRQKSRVALERTKLPYTDVGLVSKEGYEAFKTAYEMVMQGFNEVIEQLPAQEALHFRARLEAFELLSREDLNKTLMYQNITTFHKTATLVNAYYVPITKKIVFYPSLLNEPRRSKAGIATILAHELAHYMDPKVHFNGGLIGKYIFRNWYEERKNLVGYELDSCFENSFPNHTHTPEDWADWLASLVMDKLVQKYDTHLKRQRFAQNSIKFLCGKISRERNLLSKILKLMTPHSFPENRIIYFYRQPHLREALDCEGSPIENNIEISQCSLP